MKKYIIAAVFSLSLLLSPVLAHQAEAASLSSNQVNAIIGLLQAFGADQLVIAKVRIALTGGTPSPSTCANGGTNYPTCTVTVSQSLNCDTSHTRASLNAVMGTKIPEGQGAAYSFMAPAAGKSGQAKLEYPSADFTLTVSKNPCDFSAALNPSNLCQVTGWTTTPSVRYSTYLPSMCLLNPGQTYYFNVHAGSQTAPGVWTTGDCAVAGECSFMLF
ncbi:MAG: hypothetical protein WAV50_03435 [Minisyncoccia bacterium]